MRNRDRIPFRARPMLATLVPEPVHYPGWVYEEKYDGIRILAYKEGSRVTLRSRNDKDKTGEFAKVAGAVGELSSRTLLLDGEVVALDRQRISRFQLLQRRQLEPAYAVFDCLYRDGHDLRRQPLIERRAALEGAIGEKQRRRQGLFATRRLGASGLAAYNRAQERGLEGVVAKDPASPYIEGRSTRWLKVKVHAEEEFVIGGYTLPAGSRTHFGALLLGAYSGSDLYYVGKVGTGFSRATLASLHRRFQPLIRQTSPFVHPPREPGAIWIAPKLVAQIAFQEWTRDRRLRQPVFLGLRDDKEARECLLPAEPLTEP
jgi:DNA ligase D-like protein (predicted ligase)